MRLRRRQRLRIAFLAVLCLLFQQVAIAAYACALPSLPPVAAAMAEDCAEMGMAAAVETPAICAAHCAPDQAVLLDHATPSVPALELPAVRYAEVDPATPCAPAYDPVPVDRSDPPPRLRYCSLLI